MIGFVTNLNTTVWAQNDCTGPTIDAERNITMSCIAIDGELYRGVLNPVGSEEWKFNIDEYKPSTCSWNPDTCVTVMVASAPQTRTKDIAQTWEAKLPKLGLKDEKDAITILRYVPHSHPDDPEGYYWTFFKQLVVYKPDMSDTSEVTHASSPEGFSGSYGTLRPYISPPKKDGTGRKLLAVYMVGSDLESEGEAGTSDFGELIAGYQVLSDPTVDVIVAFGGAKKKGWKGMKFVDMNQIIQDGEDGVFGNSGNYLYQEDRAHMGDKSSLQLFLSYVKDGYVNYQSRILVFWDHGASYLGFGNDENYDSDGLTLEEIDSGLLDSQVGKFELIGFDACLMASAEVAQFVRNHANYLLASEELEPGHGWNWTTVISAYSSNDNVVEVAKHVIDDFVDNTKYSDPQDGKTLSVVDLGQFPAMLEAFDAFASSGVTDSSKNALIQAATNSREYGKQSKADQRISIDWKHFSQLIKKNTVDTDQQQKLDRLIAAIEKYVLYTKDDGTRPDSYGVSFGGLENQNTVSISTSYKNFKDAFLNIRQGDTIAPVVQEQNTDVQADDLLSGENLEGEIEFVEEDTDNKNALRSQIGRHVLPFLDGERATFVHFSMPQVRALTNVHGISAQFFDENLTRITTLFGNIFPVSVGEGDKMVNHFLTVAEVEAYPSDKKPGFYFTPQWNQKWYTIEFDAKKMTEWMPMAFQYRYQKEGKTYTYYSAEIDYISADDAKLIQIGENGELVQLEIDKEGYPVYAKDAQGNPIDPIQLATLDIIVDDQNTVVEHSIHPYQILYTGEANDEGYVQFARMTYTLQQGDVVSFYTKAINLDTTEYHWLPSSGYITFTQEPKFMVEELAFEDEKAQPLSYHYTMQAEDIAGNIALTELAKVAGR